MIDADSLLNKVRENVRRENQNHLVHLDYRRQKQLVNGVINGMNNLTLITALSNALCDLVKEDEQEQLNDHS